MKPILTRAEFVLLGSGALFLIALYFTPIPKSLTQAPASSTEFVDRRGEPLRILLVDERHRNLRTALREVSPSLIAATLAAEDKRFFQHHGVDFFATARAIRQAMLGEQFRSGASTVTQQLVKLSRPGPRNLTTKLTEIWLALRLECAWSKDHILEEYLNRLDYGNLQTGIASASRYYFDKPASDLSAAESAFLAGLPKAPTRLDPYRYFSAARARQFWVLNRLRENRSIDAAAWDRAKNESLTLRSPHSEFAAPHFVDLLLQRSGILPSKGGPVRTTLDLELNRFAERSLAEQLVKIADKHATSGAVVIIDNPTGQVLALAGSGNYFQPGAGQVNGAWSARSPGSAMKPFTYLLALEHGAFPGTIVPDVPTDFSTATGLYHPNNYNHRFYGPVNLRFALGNSLNVAAVRTLELCGGAETLHQTLCQLGITTLGHPADYYGLGLTLGNAEVHLLELANAFATLGRLGVYRPYQLLLHHDATAKTGRRLFDEKSSFLLADMLSDNIARSASFGPNSWLSFDFPVACKTGTSSDYRDNWCIGYTPEFTVAVWVGNPDNSSMHEITGVTGAGPIMHDIFVHLHEQRGTSWFNAPKDLLTCHINPRTGHRVSAETSGAVEEKCINLPPDEQPTERDATGRVILPAIYSDWIKSSQNGLGNLAVAAQTSPQLRIVSPLSGTVYFYDADLPAASQRVSLLAESSGPVKWSTPSLLLTKDRATLVPGKHTLVVTDSQTGKTASTWIEVRPW